MSPETITKPERGTSSSINWGFLLMCALGGYKKYRYRQSKKLSNKRKLLLGVFLFYIASIVIGAFWDAIIGAQSFSSYDLQSLKISILWFITETFNGALFVLTFPLFPLTFVPPSTENEVIIFFRMWGGLSMIVVGIYTLLIIRRAVWRFIRN